MPTAACGREVDAGEQRRERRAVDRNLGRVAVDARQLEAAGLEALGENAPSRAVEPDRLRESPPPVEEEIEMTVDGVETETPNGTR